MINLLSIQCGLTFAPYLVESVAAFLETGETSARVIRQAANGFIVRAEDKLWFRHQNHEAVLTRADAGHFLATIGFRQEVYDVKRTMDEVVFASVGKQLLLSHPQSEMWVEAHALPTLLEAFHHTTSGKREHLPEWLTIAGGDGRLLLSDQRNGRWVLLGADHYAELERRFDVLNREGSPTSSAKPPTFILKGAKIALQSLIKLEQSLEAFAETGAFTPYEEITPAYQLLVMQAIEGMKISDGKVKVAITRKEAAKWSAILKSEIATYRLQRIERGSIRTVLATVAEGKWLLQWGDEVLVSEADVHDLLSLKAYATSEGRLASKQEGSFLLLLDKTSGGCVALNQDEIESAIWNA
ncbi:MAG: hypothetical protein HY231_25705 [Acidobacteria bacterium]|nr:hypothetical protein [Acidobacteriota bacterium]